MPSYCAECGEQFDPKFSGATHCYLCYCLLNQDKITNPQKAWLMKKMNKLENKENKSLFGISDKEMGILDNDNYEASFSGMNNPIVAKTREGIGNNKYEIERPYNADAKEYYKKVIAPTLWKKENCGSFKIKTFGKCDN